MKKRKHSSVWTAVALAMALAVISYYPENHGGSGPSRGEKAPDSSPDFPAHDASTPDSSTPDSSARTPSAHQKQPHRPEPVRSRLTLMIFTAR